MRSWVPGLLGVVLVAVSAVAGAQSGCPSRLFVSGYLSTVHVYDACTGAYLRDLDAPTRIRGAQAVRLGPDGLIYVVSEISQQILRYRNDTLAFVDAFVTLPGGTNPTALAFEHGNLLIAGFETDDVRRYSAAGAFIGTAVAPRAEGLNGPDNGMTFGPDGALYVPSYNNSALFRFDVDTGVMTRVVTAGTAGLRNTRGLVHERGTSNLLITSEGSGAVLRYHTGTRAVSVLRAGLNIPTGIDYAPNGDLLVAAGDRVVRLDPQTGADRGTLVPFQSGGLRGSTFIAVLPLPAGPATVVEFYHAGFDHYFISSLPADIEALDSGRAPGWARTGATFIASSIATTGTSPVCRFYLPPTNGDSHFYSASPAECADVLARFPTFVYEAPDVFHIALPHAGTGACPDGTIPVYRLWNGRVDSNHRYTTSLAVRAQMIARGYIAEGYGAQGVIMCAAT